ncbi:MAG: hypothetical protein ACRD2X_07760 [Vicinamibacteraceae bacterium]
MCRSHRRLIVTVATATIATATTANAYVLPVFDLANWLRNQATRVNTALHLEILTQQYDALYKMAKRLSTFVDLRARYGTGGEQPKWRIHAFEGDTFPYGRDYLAALNYGDPGGRAYDHIGRHLEPATIVPEAMGAAAREGFASAYATIELADDMIRTDTHQAGRLRRNGREILKAIDQLEVDALDGDLTQSTTALLDRLSAGAVMELKQQQARNQLLAAALEQALLNNKRRRDAEAVLMNMRVNNARYYGEYSHSFWPATSHEEMRAWRQP